ncbi:MAG TPA: DNA repair protein RecO [Pyrinomonadaceae bacterium]|nr:DNA repair protein RecO [Pyrinomonadaceae bacterium]
MGLVETEGLVLKSYGLAEADKIVVLLTQNEGLVRGVAKGAKRLKSRFGGGLEPFSVVQISYFQKEERELVSISHIELIKSYFEKASDPEFFEKFAYLVELLVEFAPPHDPNEKLYRMAKICLETASENPQNLGSTVVYFELWMLRLGGYLPDWNRCDNCKREFGADEKAALQINFHLQCQSCQKGRNDWQISAAEREIFKNAQKLSPGRFVEFAANKEKNVREVSNTLKRIISNILGRDINAQKKSVAGT